MGMTFSPVANAASAAHGGHFSARRLDLDGLGASAYPVMGFDHYRMAGPTFAPHPHAGFSAVSYVFEDSAGALRNRDSLGHDVVIEPGEMVWTQAGSGVVHDEFPSLSGREVHGVQIFVNLARRHKDLPPQMFYARTKDIYIVREANGSQTRVLAGKYGQVAGAIQPVEPFDFFDVRVAGEWRYDVPERRNVVIYSVSGNVDVEADGESRSLNTFQAVSVRSDKGGRLVITASSPAQVLVLSGTDPREPLAVYGPFIMNNQSQLTSALERYRSGQMGHLVPLDHMSH